MDEIRIDQYAELIVKTGLRVVKDEEVWIWAEPDQLYLLTKVVEKCYQAGAKKVKTTISYSPITKLNYLYQDEDTLATLPDYELDLFKYRADKFVSRLFIESEDPDALAGCDEEKISNARMRYWPTIKPYIDKTFGRHKWCIVGAPSVAWAKKVFPELNDNDAVEALWEAIFKTVRIDGNDPIKNWEIHNKTMNDKCALLNSYKFKYLEYKASNGTNFKVELNDLGLWAAAEETTDKGLIFNPNMPTEEVFTSPKVGSCEGLLVASKPLSYNGKLIEDFSIEFKDGKVSKVKAKTNQEVLEKMIKMDEGASKLGEVALVPFTSPINQCGILFYSTLFDENAVCHFALGCGFKENCLKGGLEMSMEEALEKGVNDSMIHVDFMIGTADLEIIGITKEGKRIQVFKNGVWAI